MNPSQPIEAVQFGLTAAKAFDAHGGVDLARQAEADLAIRTEMIAVLLERLGAGELDPRADLEVAVAAGELCRAAGRVVLAFPLVAWLLRVDDTPLALVGPAASDGLANEIPVDHGDLFGRWRLGRVTPSVDGANQAIPAGDPLRSRLGPFVTQLHGEPGGSKAPVLDVELHLCLSAYYILGVVERALELAIDHVQGRVQFSKPLSSFQAVQFSLADAAVAVEGLRQLCGFTLWRVNTEPDRAMSDALGLRLGALDSARMVLRTTQQLFGAAGLCDEYDISILVRHVQPLLRVPFGAARTAEELAGAIRQMGFDSLFPHGASR